MNGRYFLPNSSIGARAPKLPYMSGTTPSVRSTARFGGSLSATDVDPGETFRYAVVGGADSGVFSIGGSGADELILTDGVLDFESQASYQVTVRVTDGGGSAYDQTFTIAVNHLGETRTKADLVGSPTVLWFFPIPDSPG